MWLQERVECLDRMERRAIRDRVALDRQAGVRDLILRGDLSKWLERRIADLEKSAETRDGEVGFSPLELLRVARHQFRIHFQDAAFMRTVLRSSRRRKGTAALLSELQNGTLRRATSQVRSEARLGKI